MTYLILKITSIAALVGGLTTILVEHFLIKDRNFESRQWEIKRDACLEALSAIDSMFSHRDWGNISKSPTKQKIDIARIRECHSKLILSCKDIRVVEKFLEIVLPMENADHPTKLLNELRNLIRAELNFGTKKLDLDTKRVWIGSIHGDDK